MARLFSRRRSTPLSVNATRKSRCRTVRGRKAKGRQACLDFQQLVLASFTGLTDADVYVKTGSAGGVDIHFSEKGRKLFPFAVEIKNQESLNIWKALAQAQANATPKNLPAIVFFKRSRSPMFVALRADVFLDWVK